MVVSSESVSIVSRPSDASTVVSTVMSNQVRVSSLYVAWVASCEYTVYCDVVSEYIVRE